MVGSPKSQKQGQKSQKQGQNDPKKRASRAIKQGPPHNGDSFRDSPRDNNDIKEKNHVKQNQSIYSSQHIR
jgi:hypothetical protein